MHGIGAGVAAGYWRTNPEPEHVEIGGIRCLRFAPSTAPRGTVLHIHGGTFRIGCPEMIAPFAAALAERCRVTVVCPAYRLAPEQPFPAGLRDCLTVLIGLTRDTQGPVILSGDSAGGGLAASLAAIAAELSIPISGLPLLSPWLDLTVSSATCAANEAPDPLFSTASAQDAATLYLQVVLPDEPLASPLLGSVTSYPQTYINVGTGEVLLDDSRRFHATLRDAGVPAWRSAGL